jgi:putative DNA primase/helicase
VYSGGDAGGASASGHPQVKKWALKALSRRHIEDALKQLQSLPEIVTRADAFDRDRWLFNVKNGTIDLRTGELREHRREDLITRIAPVEFNPASERPRLWEEFLAEIFGGNCGLTDFVRRACGYALTGSVSEQKLFFLHGSGANGKTTFLETLMYVMGGYARRLAPSLLFAASRDMHPTGLADLKGSRLAVTTEVEFGKRLAEAVVKELTGGDRLAARRMRQDSFEFEPTHKVFMCGNHLPVVRGSDHAIWRRIVLIPFSVTIPEERQDKDLTGKLRAEAAGILNWLVTGCLEWQKKGLGEPCDVTTATRAYRSDMDALGVFLSDHCVLTPKAQTTSADLYKAYGQWCEKNSEYPMSACALGLGLKEHGLKQKRTKLGRTWQGICLKGKRS